MIKAAFLALGDVMSADFRAVLYKAVGMTIGLFIAVLIAVEVLISMLTLLPWPWAEAMLAIGTGVALFIVFFFLMAPVMAIFAGFFLDEIAGRIERAHYPQDVPGKPLGAAPAIVTALQFAAVVLVVNIAVLPMVFFGVGALALIAANAYLLSREFFEIAADYLGHHSWLPGWLSKQTEQQLTQLRYSPLDAFALIWRSNPTQRIW